MPTKLNQKIDGRRARRKDPKVYRAEFEASVGKEFELVSEYTKSSEHVTVRHHLCGSEFKALPSAFVKQPACRHCDRQRRRLNPDIFEERFNQNLGGSFELISPYTRQSDPIQIRHLKCGEIFNIAPKQITTRVQCPTCRKKESKLSEDTFLERLQAERYQGYQISYQTYAEEKAVQIKHLECGEVFMEHPGVFLKKPNCPACEKDYVDDESFKTKIQERYKGKFDLISTFRGYQYPICVQHTDSNCLKYAYPFATNFSTGHFRCPHCESRNQKHLK